MRSIDAGISSVDCGARVAVTTTASSCAAACAHSAAAAMPASVLPISARLQGMKLSVFLALIASLAWAQPDPSLVEKLRQGGYVLYLRHTSTDFTQNDARMKSYAD